MTEYVKVEIEAGVMTVTLARPDKKNALSNAMYGVLADSLEQAERDPAIRVVVFQADGDSFSSGNDLQDFAAQATGAFTGERHVMRFLKNLAKATRPLGALTVTKSLMRDAEAISALMDKEGELFAARLQTAEAREAFMAFAERRAPDFSKVS